MFPIRDTIPSRHLPWMTWTLIAVNIAVFAYQLLLSPIQLEGVFYRFGIVPARFSDPAWALAAGLPSPNPLPFLTSMFIHGGFLHLLFNLWTLWIFGDNVEDRMGPWRFLLFYLLTGLAAGVLHWMTALHSTIPTIGASGAIAGVLGAYFLLYPRAKVLTLVPLLFWPLFFELPAFVYLGFWFLTQLLSGASSLGGAAAGGIAWWAHIGGFVAGLALHRLFLSHRRTQLQLPQRHFVMPRQGQL